jgi:hypothetical protein
MRGNILTKPDVDVLVMGKPFRKATNPDHRRERRHKGLHPKTGDHGAVDGAHRRTGENAQRNGDNDLKRCGYV